MTHLISLRARYRATKKKPTTATTITTISSILSVFFRVVFCSVCCLWLSSRLPALSLAPFNVSCSFFSLIKSWFDVNYTRHICVVVISVAAPQFCDFAFIVIILWFFLSSARSVGICFAFRTFSLSLSRLFSLLKCKTEFGAVSKKTYFNWTKNV